MLLRSYCGALRAALLVGTCLALFALYVEPEEFGSLYAAALKGGPRGGPRICVPFALPPAEGSWVQGATPDDLKWEPLVPCSWAVGSREAFLDTFAGRTLAFVGDSQVRFLCHHLVGHIGGCCAKAGGTLCDVDAVLDARACEVLEGAGSYPSRPQVFVLQGRGGANVTVLFEWLPFPVEALARNSSTMFLHRFIEGIDTADAVMLSFGHWPLIFDAPEYFGGTTSRTDNLAGLENLLRDSRLLADVMRAAPRERLRRILWRRIYPDEVDCLPHPRFHKRLIQPPFRAQAKAGLSEIFGEGGLGLKEWDVSYKLDVRAQNATRPINEDVLTWDGMHLRTAVDIELAWELASWWAHGNGGDDASAWGLRARR